MRCRRNVYDSVNKNYNTVWFGSTGLQLPKMIFVTFGNTPIKNIYNYTAPEADRNYYIFNGVVTNKELTNSLKNNISVKISEIDIVNNTFTIKLNDSGTSSFDVEEDSSGNSILSYTNETSGFETITNVGTESNPEYQVNIQLDETTYDYSVNSTTSKMSVSYSTDYDITIYFYNSLSIVDGNGTDIQPYLKETITMKPKEEAKYEIPMCAKKVDSISGNKNINFSEKQNSVADSLIQKLSILQKELWYNIEHGLPLLDKVKGKTVFDAVIINIVLNTPGVVNIQKFTSYVKNYTYYIDLKIMTIYNEEIEIQNAI